MTSEMKARFTSFCCALLLTRCAAATLVITEIMKDPSAAADSVAEWFEVYNAGASDVDMAGFELKDDGSDSHTVAGSVVVRAGAYAVFANTDHLAGGVTVDYVYGTRWYLGNSADELVILDNTGVEVDRVDYTSGWGALKKAGYSKQLKSPGLDNNDLSNWCLATSAFHTGDYGTPGKPNDCPKAASTLSPDGDASGAAQDSQRNGRTRTATLVLATAIPCGIVFVVLVVFVIWRRNRYE